MNPILPKQSFLALAAVGWADGRLSAVERTGLGRAAKECGVAGDDLAEVEAALKTKTDLSGFVPGDMTDWQRLVTYALGTWLARLDGVMSTDEHESLLELGKRLDLDKKICERASVAAFDISVLKDQGRPDKFDFVKLEERLREKLPGYAKG